MSADMSKPVGLPAKAIAHGPETVAVAVQERLELRPSAQIASVPQSSEAEIQAARDRRRELNRDAETELALDSLSRSRDQELAQSKFRASNLESEVAALQRETQQRQEQLGIWRVGAGAGVVGTLLMGVLWLRARRRADLGPDALDSASGFDSSSLTDIDKQAIQSALLPDALTQGGGQKNRAAAWVAEVDADSHSRGGVHEYDLLDGGPDSMPAEERSDLRAGTRAGIGLHEAFIDTDGKPGKPLLNSDPGGAFVDSQVPEHAAAPGPAQALSLFGPLARSNHDLRELRSRGPSEGVLPTASGFASTEMASVVMEAFTAAELQAKELPDVQFVPQPMQDLLLLYRGLQEWEAESRLGVAEQALLHHIDEHESTSGWVYLELLTIYRRRENKSSFMQWADTFRARFNRLAPTWVDAGLPGRDLLRYDMATVQLTQAWANNSVVWLLEQWLVGEPHMRRFMDVAAFRDVMQLYELSLMVNDNADRQMSRRSLQSVQ